MIKNGINEFQKRQAKLFSEISELALLVTHNTIIDVFINYYGHTNTLDVFIHKTGWREDHKNMLSVEVDLVDKKDIDLYKDEVIIRKITYFAIRKLEFLKEFLKNILVTGKVDEEYFRNALSEIDREDREYYKAGYNVIYQRK